MQGRDPRERGVWREGGREGVPQRDPEEASTGEGSRWREYAREGVREGGSTGGREGGRTGPGESDPVWVVTGRERVQCHDNTRRGGVLEGGREGGSMWEGLQGREGAEGEGGGRGGVPTVTPKGS